MSENGTTTEELLQQVESAISAVLSGGQSYRIGSRQLTRADLSQLKAIREDLKAQAESELRKDGLMSGTVVAFFDGR